MSADQVIQGATSESRDRWGRVGAAIRSLGVLFGMIKGKLAAGVSWSTSGSLEVERSLSSRNALAIFGARNAPGGEPLRPHSNTQCGPIIRSAGLLSGTQVLAG
jgi:hypothetical protein